MRDLLYAGFRGEFTYERDGNNLDHGIWQFEGETSDRSLSQISQLNVLSQGLGRANLNRMLDEHQGPNVRQFIQQATSDYQTQSGMFGASKRPPPANEN